MCERLYETGGITNEGGEKTILQSNNMVALRVSLLYLGMVWYDNIKDDIRDDIYQRSIKYVQLYIYLQYNIYFTYAEDRSEKIPSRYGKELATYYESCRLNE